MIAKSHTNTVVYLLVFVAATRCGFDPPLLSGDFAPCLTDFDCPNDQFCSEQQCFASPADFWELGFDVEIRPPPRSLLIAAQRAGVMARTNELWTFALPVPIPHEISVFDTGMNSVDADISFVLRGGISNQPLNFVHQIRSDHPIEIRLNQGTYDVQITPQNPSRPSIDFGEFIVDRTDTTVRRTFVLPQRYRQLTGTVRNRVSLTQRLAQVEVSAEGVPSGLLSTVSITDADGNFSIDLPETNDTSFLLTAKLPKEFQPSWQFSETIVVPPGEDIHRDIDIDIPSDAVRGFITLSILGFGPEGPEAVTDARVTLSATGTSVVNGRSFLLTGRTRVDGRVETDGETMLPILNGIYNVVVEPSVQSQFTRYEGVLSLDDVGNNSLTTEQLTLSRRSEVTGVINDPLATPVPSALATFYPVNSERRPIETLADENGSYSIFLDPGAYLMVAESRSSSSDVFSTPLSRGIRQVIVPPEQATVYASETQLTRGATINGRLMAANDLDLDDIEIIFFESISDIRIPLDRATTDPEGNFAFVISIGL